MGVKEQVSLPSQRICSRCKFVSSQEVCKACVLLEGLNKGLPKLGIGKSSKAKRMLEEYTRKDGKENLKQAVDELNNDMDNISICQSKTKSCKSGLCKSDKEIINVNLNKDKAIEIGNKVDSKKCKNKCSRTCNGNINNLAQGESKINTLLKEYGLEESGRPVTNTQEDDAEDDKNIESHSSDEGDLKEDESCVGGCGTSSIGISF